MITVIRGELLGGVQLTSRLGAAEAERAIERCLKRMERVVDGFRGRLLRAGSGQISVAFPTPEEACMAGIEMQRRVADLPPVSGVKLTIRLGVHGADSEESASLIAAQLQELALPDAILCSREILTDAAHSVGIRVRDLHQVELSGGEAFQVMELMWHGPDEDDTLTSTSFLALQDQYEDEGLPTLEVPLPKLRVNFQGKSLLLDEKTPFITLGRDQNSDLVINDHKASRQHARIERKDGRYYLTDTSTNGTFITFQGEREILVRKEIMPLRRNGLLSFGVSATDPEASKAEFEHL